MYVNAMRPSVCAYIQERLESTLAEVGIENTELASKVRELEAQCKSLEVKAKSAEQQQRHDLACQDELVKQHQQAAQVSVPAPTHDSTNHNYCSCTDMFADL